MEPGFTRLIKADNLGPRARHQDRSGSRTTPATRPTRSRTASSRSRCPPPASSARRCSPAPRTGNLANAVAAAGARAGIRDRRVHPARPRAGRRSSTTAVYGGTLVAVRGNYDDVNRLASEIAGEEEGWAFVNVNVRPYYAEGSKTLGYEVAEQLGWRLPEQVVIPVASGSQLTKVDKGVPGADPARAGRGDAVPDLRRPGRRAAPRCRPPSRTATTSSARCSPDTIAKSLAIGNPADGPYVLDVARRTGGAVEDVTDERGRRGHPAAGPHRGHLRRDRGRRDRRDAEEAGRDRPARPGRRDRRVQHRRRAQDARRGRRTGWARRRPSTRRTPRSVDRPGLI